MNNALIFVSVSVFSCLVSFLLDRQKTIVGFKKGFKMFRNIVIPFINILILVSILMYLVPPQWITTYLGAASGVVGFGLAAIVGSITLIPGFISYPIAAGLLKQGASYATVAVLMTTLMMVGVVTLPLEIKYFGKEVAILRNLLNFIAAIIIGLFIGIVL
ncbi:MAG: permease [Anaerolineae bacterium]